MQYLYELTEEKMTPLFVQQSARSHVLYDITAADALNTERNTPCSVNMIFKVSTHFSHLAITMKLQNEETKSTQEMLIRRVEYVCRAFGVLSDSSHFCNLQ